MTESSATRFESSRAWNSETIGHGQHVEVLNLDWIFMPSDGTGSTPHQLFVIRILKSLRMQAAIACLIAISMVLLAIETDVVSAKGYKPDWLIHVSRFVLFVYVVELGVRLYAYRVFFFMNAFNVVDFAVVVLDFFLEFYTLATDVGGLPRLNVLRALRLLKLARAYRVMSNLPMLSGMVRDLVGALEAVIWGCLLLFICMTLWSVLGVQLIDPVIQDLARDTDAFADCPRCPHAFSTVMHSNLSLFQTMIAGDSWGRIALPVIEHNGWTAFFFVGAIISLNLMLMNVILAAIVDKARETRENDIHTILVEKEKKFVESSAGLLKVCQELDRDASGDVSLEELMYGWDNHKEFAKTFHLLGIHRDDLKTVFQIMDADSGGTVDYKEFIAHIQKMKNSDMATILDYIRHYVVEILQIVRTDAVAIEQVKTRKGVSEDPSSSAGSCMFEESRRTQADGIPIATEATPHAAQVRSDISKPDECRHEHAGSSLQHVRNAALEDLSHAIKEIVSMSDVHLKLLQSIEKAMGTAVAKIDGKYGLGLQSIDKSMSTIAAEVSANHACCSQNDETIQKMARQADGRSYWHNSMTQASQWQPPNAERRVKGVTFDLEPVAHSIRSCCSTEHCTCDRSHI